MRPCWINVGMILVLVVASVTCDGPRALPSQGAGSDRYAEAREEMVATQIAARGIRDAAVLQAMRRVPRHLFVPEEAREHAYYDSPLAIGHNQTISQPYIVALMTELAGPEPTDRALEVGTGSGYQAAVLSGLVKELFTIEIVDALAEQARSRLSGLGFDNVVVRSGDGYAGWPERAPFDVIIVTAAPDHVPPALLEQLSPGGRMVIPVGPRGSGQVLRLIDKDKAGKLRSRDVAPVLFVPLLRREPGQSTGGR